MLTERRGISSMKRFIAVLPASFASCLIAANSISQINSADLGLKWHGGY